MAAGKRFDVLFCADDSEYVKKMYEGYFDVFRKMLAQDDKRLDMLRVAFPNEKR
ncbi:putative glutamine amidotransferase [Tripterygium wilfordii]|uniref:Putative glutamine amidotransferase n=1 Tax=Tripterygium wilfordii TaxID=458696 RepID=A0A7J7DTB7_TRIWF|nr:putative glutamine amidotransferase [Tripterygium wilfordii]